MFGIIMAINEESHYYFHTLNLLLYN